jgi:hypothetical protein
LDGLDRVAMKYYLRPVRKNNSNYYCYLEKYTEDVLTFNALIFNKNFVRHLKNKISIKKIILLVTEYDLTD